MICFTLSIPECLPPNDFRFLIIVLVGISGSARGNSPFAAPPTQENFRAATVVTASGDTLDGQIEHWKPRTHTPEAIHFRRGHAERVRVYQPTNLKAVNLKDETRRFVSRAVEVDQVPTDPKRANDFLQAGRRIKKPDTLLLEVVVEGVLTLYTKQGNRDRYYIEIEDEITELIKRTRYLPSKGGMATNHRYRRQLANHMSGCGEVLAKAKHAKLTYRSLREIVVEYNQCKTGTVAFLAENLLSVDVTFGITAGVARSSPSVSGNVRVFEGDSVIGPISRKAGDYTFEWTTGYVIGAGITFRPQSAWALQTQFTFASENFTSISPAPKIVVNHRALRLAAMSRYYFQSSTWAPYVEVGLGCV